MLVAELHRTFETRTDVVLTFETRKDVAVQKSYDFIYRRKSSWELMKLSFIIMGIEFTYTALTAFVSPVLLELGIKYRQMTLVWGISPIIGFFLSPIMGSLSDRCDLSYGRRRPFIIIFAGLNIIGLALIPYGRLLGSFCDDNNEPRSDSFMHSHRHPKTWAITLTVIGVAIADYTSDALQSPSRAYLLDVCNTDDHSRGLTVFTIVAGFGGFVSYLLASVDWKRITVVDGIFDNHVQAFFIFVIMVFSVCVLITVTTFNEMPLCMLHPCQHSLENSSSVNNNRRQKSYTEKSGLIANECSHDAETCRDSSSSTSSVATVGDYILSIIKMPYSLRILCLANLFCWMCHTAYSLYFTDFVGEVVFGGNPSAPEGSGSRKLYEKGVRFACIGMSVYSLSCMCYSFAIENLIRQCGLRVVYIGAMLVNSVSLLLMVMFKCKLTVILLSSTCGILYSTLFTVPYILVAHYHSIHVFEIDSKGNPVVHNQIRGLGTDISIVGSCVFVAQFLLSLFIGQVVSLVGSVSAIMCAASFFGCCGALVASKVVYMDK